MSSTIHHTAHIQDPALEAIDFVREMQSFMLEKRDRQSVLAALTDDVTWFGTGAHEVCNNIAQARECLQHDMRDYPNKFTITRDTLQAQKISEHVYVVRGELFAKPVDIDYADFHTRMTVVCQKTPDGWRASHMHFSRPDIDQDVTHAYVRRDVEEDRIHLREKVDETLRQLSEHHAALKAFTANIPGGVHQCAHDDNFTLVNMSAGFLELVGYTREEMRDLFCDRFAELILAEDRANVMQQAAEQAAYNSTISLEYRIRHKSGQILWILDKGKLITLPDGTQNFFCVMLDVTSQRAEQAALRLSLERHQIIMDQTSDVIFEWDLVSDSLTLSANWRKRYGYEPISSNIMRDLVTSGDIYPDDVPALVGMMTSLREGTPYHEVDIRLRSECGYIWSRVRATTQSNGDGTPIKAVGVIVDIDLQKKQNQELEAQARYDQLTGLLNKAAGQSSVANILRTNMATTGVFFIIDLDDFKQINDIHGHLYGDTVLADVGEALSRLFRALDVTARIGGDEFMVYMPSIGLIEASKKAALVIEAISKIEILGQACHVRCSVGAALYPQDATNFNGLYHCADVALYHVKNTGKSDFAFYDAANDTREHCDATSISALGAPIESEARLLKDQLAAYCFSMLYHSVQPELAVRQLSEIIGRTNDVSRVYIFESSDDGKRCSNTFEWCNIGIESAIDSLQDIDYEHDIDGYQSNFDENGVFYCQEIAMLSDSPRRILQEQGITSVLQCAIMDDGEFRGFVGFDECNASRKWKAEHVETLSFVANVLSTFLLKMRLKERLAKLEMRGASCLDGQDKP